MRLVLLSRYGHETEQKKAPLVRKRRPSGTQHIVRKRRHTFAW
jgi:hypothetical protein